ncbi:MAG: adenosylcobinamide-GDP ribazoletransferase [Caldilineaceae bacterium]|nr:adenosylcobinamide-GDP ribazoletransferase [Caldilineaceae bacterium]
MLITLRAALSFLTTLPVPPPTAAQFEDDPGLGGRAFSWYPAVGLLIGLILAALAAILWLSPLPAAARAGIILGAWIAITGGLHLDGLMDSCDALFAPVDVARRLAILKDVHTGAFGVIGVVWLLGMKWTLLTYLLAADPLAPVLLLAPLWGRWMLVWAAGRFPYARRESSLGSFMRQGLGSRQIGLASLFALSIHAGIVIWLGPALLWIVLAPLVGIALAYWSASRLGGGLTGDLYGALCEVVELAVLLLAAMI